MSSLVSIVIPAWERPALLPEVLDSCLAQTYRDIEVVVADDSRTDRVARAIEPYLAHPRVRYERNQVRLGQSGNVNRLFDLARGERLVLLHDDDTLLPDAVEVLDECWRRHPNLTACYGKLFIVTHAGIVLDDMTEATDRVCARTAVHAGLQRRPLWPALAGQFPSDGFMVSTAAARATRFRPYEEVGDACDFDFKLRLSQQPGWFYFLDRYVSNYRITDTSVSSTPETIDHAFEIACALDVPSDMEPMRRRFLRDRGLHAVRRYLLIGHRALAWRLLLRTEYWPDGPKLRSLCTTFALFLMPAALIRTLRPLKHGLRAWLRRNDGLYRALLRARARLSQCTQPAAAESRLEGSRKFAHPVQPAAPGDSASLRRSR